MKRVNGEGNLRKRDDNQWELRLSMKNPYTNDTHRHSVYGRSKAEVLKKGKEYELQWLRDAVMNPSSMSVAEWFQTWYTEFIPNVKPATMSRYEQTIRCHIVPALGKIKLEMLNAIQVQRFYNDKIKEGLSPKTVHGIHGVVHKALEQARKLGYINKNVSEDCELPRGGKRILKPIVDDKLGEFLDAIQGERFEDVFFITLFTGMRECEAIGLTWDCIDFDRKTIHLYRQLSRDRQKENPGFYRFETLKNGKDRKFILADQVVDRLLDVRRKQSINRLKAGPCWRNDADFVFTNEIGEHIAIHTLYKDFKAVVRSIGLDDTRFHDLRHSYATLAIESGTDIKTVSMSLGHATTAFTMDVYGHVSEKMLLDQSEHMTDLIARIR